ncbi:MAG: hypothetical protein ACR2I1_03905 [Propionibacteriaceae bacterium]
MRPTRPVRLVFILAVVLAVVVGLRLVAQLSPSAEPAAIDSDRLVVVGVQGLTRLAGADRRLIDAHPTQIGAVTVRPSKVGECAAAGWATLGAGRRATVGGLCDIRVTDLGVVFDWRARLAVAGDAGDAHLGTLARLAGNAGGDCIASVGPGAALAAAGPDGTNAAYASVDSYIASGYVSECPVTVVDAGDQSAEVIAAVAKQSQTTVIVTGIGPPDGSRDPALQGIYRLGAPQPGWLTSSSTRRAGIVTLADLTRTMIDFAHRDGEPVTDLPIDGTPMSVIAGQVTGVDLDRFLSSVAALSDLTPAAYLWMGIGGGVAAVAIGVLALRRRWRWAVWLLALGPSWPTAMMLVGATRWWRTTQPGLVLGLGFTAILVGLTLLSSWLARRWGRPVAVVAAGITVVAFTAEALTGGVAEPGSMLNSRPIFALRWYGFGNVTFAAYAAGTLLLAGALAWALPLRSSARSGSAEPRLPGLWRSLVVLAVGLVMASCEGRPGMGSDFGGVIAITPGVLWLALKVSGRRLRWWFYPAIAGAAVVAGALVSWLDWLRPADDRSHLGRFFQRVLDGDWRDVVVRKATAMLATVISPVGIGVVLVGIVIWVAIFRFAVPRLEPTNPGLRWTLVAAVVTAVVGTLANDGGTSVWITLTGACAVAIGCWLLERQRALSLSAT